jgi:hypothetical protein
LHGFIERSVSCAFVKQKRYDENYDTYAKEIVHAEDSPKGYRD